MHIIEPRLHKASKAEGLRGKMGKVIKGMDRDSL
jgi:hypothetical protein